MGTTRNPRNGRLEDYEGQSETVPHAFEGDAPMCSACGYGRSWPGHSPAAIAEEEARHE